MTGGDTWLFMTMAPSQVEPSIGFCHLLRYKTHELSLVGLQMNTELELI